MQYLREEKSIAQVTEPRGLVIGPTLAWRPTRTGRFDLSPLFGCTGDAPRVEIFAVFSLSLGKTTTGETETPISRRTR